VVLVRVHAANYERSEGAKQCVVFHPQVPPNNIRRNFFFPHSVNSTFFLIIIGKIGQSVFGEITKLKQRV
jgi:hypothetical protein